MAETITKQQFLEKTGTAVAAILKKHKLPDKPQGGIIRDWDLWGFVLREVDLEGRSLKEVNALAAEVSHTLGGKPAIYGDGGHILVGFIGKPNASVFQL
jgi:hypothetical protein